MRDTPVGWSRISSALHYQDPHRAIDWLCRAFGFEVRIKVEGEDGRIEHSELVIGSGAGVGVIMVGGEASPRRPDSTHRKSPRSLGGSNTQNVMIYLDDVDAHCARARAAGATITTEPVTTDHGEGYWVDRCYEVSDVEGHRWWFCQRIRER